jgi:hypothetical protein
VFGARLYTQGASIPYWSAAALMGVVLVLVAIASRQNRDWGRPGGQGFAVGEEGTMIEGGWSRHE